MTLQFISTEPFERTKGEVILFSDIVDARVARRVRWLGRVLEMSLQANRLGTRGAYRRAARRIQDIYASECPMAEVRELAEMFAEKARERRGWRELGDLS